MGRIDIIMRLAVYAIIASLALLLPPCVDAAEPDLKAWLEEFADMAADPQTFSSGFPANAAALGIAADPKSKCPQNLVAAGHPPAFLVTVFGFLLGPQGDCASQRLGLLQIELDADPSFAAALSVRLNAKLHRQPTMLKNGPNHDLHWQLSPIAAVEVGLSSAPGDAHIVILRLAQGPRR